MPGRAARDAAGGGRAAALVVVGLAAPARAHVTITPSTTAAGASNAVLEVSVPHGCDGLVDHRGHDPDPRPGHAVSPTRTRAGRRSRDRALDLPVTDGQGNQVTERIASITYRVDTPLPDGDRDVFELSLQLPDARRRPGLPDRPAVRAGRGGLDRGRGGRTGPRRARAARPVVRGDRQTGPRPDPAATAGREAGPSRRTGRRPTAPSPRRRLGPAASPSCSASLAPRCAADVIERRATRQACCSSSLPSSLSSSAAARRARTPPWSAPTPPRVRCSWTAPGAGDLHVQRGRDRGARRGPGLRRQGDEVASSRQRRRAQLIVASTRRSATAPSCRLALVSEDGHPIGGSLTFSVGPASAEVDGHRAADVDTTGALALSLVAGWATSACCGAAGVVAFAALLPPAPTAARTARGADSWSRRAPRPSAPRCRWLAAVPLIAMYQLGGGPAP